MYTHEWLAILPFWQYRAQRAGRYALLDSLKRAVGELEYTASFDSYN